MFGLEAPERAGRPGKSAGMPTSAEKIAQNVHFDVPQTRKVKLPKPEGQSSAHGSGHSRRSRSPNVFRDAPHTRQRRLLADQLY